jgi:hypothetical protein|tara:strand:- start:1883 stop:2059 length:177 start_codon:yes stop_codon:yes gene_type:complete
MKVGDLVMCGDEAGVILRFWCQDGMNEGETEVMAECLWQNGDIEDVDAINLEALNESR